MLEDELRGIEDEDLFGLYPVLFPAGAGGRDVGGLNAESEKEGAGSFGQAFSGLSHVDSASGDGEDYLSARGEAYR